jgi:hypothetical protein
MVPRVLRLSRRWRSALDTGMVLLILASGCSRDVEHSDKRQRAMVEKYCPDLAEWSECLSRLNARCRSSPGCEEMGNCTFRNGQCAPGSDIDCRASKYCKFGGNCTERHGMCDPQSDEDCRQSDLCRSRGECYYFEEVVPMCVRASPSHADSLEGSAPSSSDK